jgi:hypothetical protein
LINIATADACCALHSAFGARQENPTLSSLVNQYNMTLKQNIDSNRRQIIIIGARAVYLAHGYNFNHDQAEASLAVARRTI